MILLDTTVVSLVFRREGGLGEVEMAVVGEVKRLIRGKAPLALPGIVLQEVLSGVRTEEAYDKLQENLRGYPVLLAVEEDHKLGAQIMNRCRKKGITASTVDCLVAAQAVSTGGHLLSTDEDYVRMSRHCRLRLWPIPSGAAGRDA